MHDQDMNDETLFSRNPYDEHGPYDVGFSAGPSRPPPIPYDDPYTDNYSPPTSQLSTAHPIGDGFGRDDGQHKDEKDFSHRSSSRRREHMGRGRGRGRGRERPDHERKNYDRGEKTGRSFYGGSTRGGNSWQHRPSYEPRSLSPTSLTTTPTTGLLPDGSSYAPQLAFPPERQWAYPASNFVPGQPFSFGATDGYPQSQVQPHINPRFAAAFAMSMGIPQPQLMPSYLPPQNSSFEPVIQESGNWTDEWIIPVSANGSEPPKSFSAVRVLF